MCTLRELLEAGNRYGYNFNIDEIITQYGEDYEWYDDYQFFAGIILSKFEPVQHPLQVTHVSYKQAYEFYEMLGKPFLVDTLFTNAGEVVDLYSDWLGPDQLMYLAENWMYNSDSWPVVAPQDWVDLANRVFPTEPYISSDEEVTEHVTETVNQASAILQDLEQ